MLWRAQLLGQQLYLSPRSLLPVIAVSRTISLVISKRQSSWFSLLVEIGRGGETRQVLAPKFQAVFPHLDERQWRLVMGAEARSLGDDDIRLVARAKEITPFLRP
jgi:hypothetical protein